MKSANKIIQEIERQVWRDFERDVRTGFLSGLSGTAFFYDSINELYKNSEYELKLIKVIEKINELVSENSQIETFCSGLAGYGWMLLKLKNKNINIDEEYFQSLDEIIAEGFFENISSDNFDFLHGTTGISLYFIERYKHNKSEFIENTIKNFAEIFITKINTEIEVVFQEYSSIYNNGNYHFGLAHGISGYINFLIYLKESLGNLMPSINISLNNSINFLMKHRNYDEVSKQQFPCRYLLGTKTTIPARLGWCMGDLGISNSIYNAGIFLKDTKLQEEAYSIINLTKKITWETSGVNDFAICHGSAGIILQYYFAEVKFDQNNSEIISYWMKVLEKQTKNFTEFSSFHIDKYINESNLLNGLVGLGLVLLTINKKISLDWLISLNLH